MTGYSSIHTHTNFCDGRDPVELLCQTAWEKGLSALGISSHAPIGRKTGFDSDWHIKDEDLEKYLDAVREAKKRWEGRLEVYLGLEVDYITDLMGPADRDYREMGLDYVIGSVHYLIPPKDKPFTVDGSPGEFEKGLRRGFGGDAAAMVQAYWEAEEGMIRAGGLDVLGHVDLIRKNNPRELWFSETNARYQEHLAALTELLAGRRDIVVEVNTGGINRKTASDTYPSLPFLRLLRERDIALTITADAHRAEDLDGHYLFARENLLNSGHRETLLFRGRKEGRPIWRKKALLPD